MLFTSLNSFPADITWQGIIDNNWHNPANWSTNTVPTTVDNVTIPSGTSICKAYSIGGNKTLANSLKNYGNLEFHGGCPVIYDFQNHNQVSIHGFLSDRSVIFSDLYITSFKNYGTITSGSDCSLYLYCSNMSFYNQGTINVGGFGAYVKDFETHSLSHLESSSNNESEIINIECSNIFINNGLIKAKENIFENVPNLNITSKNIINNGFILGCNSTNKKGGDINLTATEKIVNTKYVKAGNSTNQLDGAVKPIAKKIDNTGRFISGSSTLEETIDIPLYSQTSFKTFNSPYSSVIYFGNMFIAADSILIHGDSARVEADTLIIVFNYLKISDLTEYESIFADELIVFRGTQNAVLDVSQNMGPITIFTYSPGSRIDIYCDSIIPPSQGLSFVFSPAPNVYPSDTTYINGYISQEIINDTAGASGTFNLTIQNHSTANKSFNYSISSAKGWVTTMNGTTQMLAPFQFDSLMVNYTIPSTADTLIDTVTQVLYVPGMFRDTVYSYIQSSPGSGVGIKKNQTYVDDFRLYQNYPNPFNPTTSIRFDLKKSSHVKLVVYDVLGREVALLLNEKLSYGGYTVVWLAKDYPSGVYFYKLVADEFVDVKKMLLIK